MKRNSLTKKVLVLMALVTMMLVLLVGCGNTNGDNLQQFVDPNTGSKTGGSESISTDVGVKTSLSGSTAGQILLDSIINAQAVVDPSQFMTFTFAPYIEVEKKGKTTRYTLNVKGSIDTEDNDNSLFVFEVDKEVDGNKTIVLGIYGINGMVYIDFNDFDTGKAVHRYEVDDADLAYLAGIVDKVVDQLQIEGILTDFNLGSVINNAQINNLISKLGLKTDSLLNLFFSLISEDGCYAVTRADGVMELVLPTKLNAIFQSPTMMNLLNTVVSGLLADQSDIVKGIVNFLAGDILSGKQVLNTYIVAEVKDNSFQKVALKVESTKNNKTEVIEIGAGSLSKTDTWSTTLKDEINAAIGVETDRLPYSFTTLSADVDISLDLGNNKFSMSQIDSAIGGALAGLVPGLIGNEEIWENTDFIDITAHKIDLSIKLRAEIDMKDNKNTKVLVEINGTNGVTRIGLYYNGAKHALYVDLEGIGGGKYMTDNIKGEPLDLNVLIGQALDKLIPEIPSIMSLINGTATSSADVVAESEYGAAIISAIQAAQASNTTLVVPHYGFAAADDSASTEESSDIDIMAILGCLAITMGDSTRFTVESITADLTKDVIDSIFKGALGLNLPIDELSLKIAQGRDEDNYEGWDVDVHLNMGKEDAQGNYNKILGADVGIFINYGNPDPTFPEYFAKKVSGKFIDVDFLHASESGEFDNMWVSVGLGVGLQFKVGDNSKFDLSPLGDLLYGLVIGLEGSPAGANVDLGIKIDANVNIMSLINAINNGADVGTIIDAINAKIEIGTYKAGSIVDSSKNRLILILQDGVLYLNSDNLGVKYKISLADALGGNFKLFGVDTASGSSALVTSDATANGFIEEDDGDFDVLGLIIAALDGIKLSNTALDVGIANTLLENLLEMLGVTGFREAGCVFTNEGTKIAINYEGLNLSKLWIEANVDVQQIDKNGKQIGSLDLGLGLGAISLGLGEVDYTSDFSDAMINDYNDHDLLNGGNIQAGVQVGIDLSLQQNSFTLEDILGGLVADAELLTGISIDELRGGLTISVFADLDISSSPATNDTQIVIEILRNSDLKPILGIYYDQTTKTLYLDSDDAAIIQPVAVTVDLISMIMGLIGDGSAAADLDLSNLNPLLVLADGGVKIKVLGGLTELLLGLLVGDMSEYFKPSEQEPVYKYYENTADLDSAIFNKAKDPQTGKVKYYQRAVKMYTFDTENGEMVETLERPQNDVFYVKTISDDDYFLVNYEDYLRDLEVYGEAINQYVLGDNTTGEPKLFANILDPFEITADIAYRYEKAPKFVKSLYKYAPSLTYKDIDVIEYDTGYVDCYAVLSNYPRYIRVDATDAELQIVELFSNYDPTTGKFVTRKYAYDENGNIIDRTDYKNAYLYLPGLGAAITIGHYMNSDISIVNPTMESAGLGIGVYMLRDDTKAPYEFKKAEPTAQPSTPYYLVNGEYTTVMPDGYEGDVYEFDCSNTLMNLAIKLDIQLSDERFSWLRGGKGINDYVASIAKRFADEKLPTADATNLNNLTVYLQVVAAIELGADKTYVALTEEEKTTFTGDRYSYDDTNKVYVKDAEGLYKEGPANWNIGGIVSTLAGSSTDGEGDALTTFLRTLLVKFGVLEDVGTTIGLRIAGNVKIGALLTGLDTVTMIANLLNGSEIAVEITNGDPTKDTSKRVIALYVKNKTIYVALDGNLVSDTLFQLPVDAVVGVVGGLIASDSALSTEADASADLDVAGILKAVSGAIKTLGIYNNNPDKGSGIQINLAENAVGSIIGLVAGIDGVTGLELNESNSYININTNITDSNPYLLDVSLGIDPVALGIKLGGLKLGLASVDESEIFPATFDPNNFKTIKDFAENLSINLEIGLDLNLEQGELNVGDIVSKILQGTGADIDFPLVLDIQNDLDLELRIQLAGNLNLNDLNRSEFKIAILNNARTTNKTVFAIYIAPEYNPIKGTYSSNLYIETHFVTGAGVDTTDKISNFNLLDSLLGKTMTELVSFLSDATGSAMATGDADETSEIMLELASGSLKLEIAKELFNKLLVAVIGDAADESIVSFIEELGLEAEATITTSPDISLEVRADCKYFGLGIMINKINISLNPLGYELIDAADLSTYAGDKYAVSYVENAKGEYRYVNGKGYIKASEVQAGDVTNGKTYAQSFALDNSTGTYKSVIFDGVKLSAFNANATKTQSLSLELGLDIDYDISNGKYNYDNILNEVAKGNLFKDDETLLTIAEILKAVTLDVIPKNTRGTISVDVKLNLLSEQSANALKSVSVALCDLIMGTVNANGYDVSGQEIDITALLSMVEAQISIDINGNAVIIALVQEITANKTTSWVCLGLSGVGATDLKVKLDQIISAASGSSASAGSALATAETTTDTNALISGILQNAFSSISIASGTGLDLALQSTFAQYLMGAVVANLLKTSFNDTLLDMFVLKTPYVQVNKADSISCDTKFYQKVTEIRYNTYNPKFESQKELELYTKVGKEYKIIYFNNGEADVEVKAKDYDATKTYFYFDATSQKVNLTAESLLFVRKDYDRYTAINEDLYSDNTATNKVTVAAGDAVAKKQLYDVDGNPVDAYVKVSHSGINWTKKDGLGIDLFFVTGKNTGNPDFNVHLGIDAILKFQGKAYTESELLGAGKTLADYSSLTGDGGLGGNIYLSLNLLVGIVGFDNEALANKANYSVAPVDTDLTACYVYDTTAGKFVKLAQTLYYDDAGSYKVADKVYATMYSDAEGTAYTDTLYVFNPAEKDLAGVLSQLIDLLVTGTYEEIAEEDNYTGTIYYLAEDGTYVTVKPADYTGKEYKYVEPAIKGEDISGLSAFGGLLLAIGEYEDQANVRITLGANIAELIEALTATDSISISNLLSGVELAIESMDKNGRVKGGIYLYNSNIYIDYINSERGTYVISVADLFEALGMAEAETRWTDPAMVQLWIGEYINMSGAYSTGLGVKITTGLVEQLISKLLLKGAPFDLNALGGANAEVTIAFAAARQGIDNIVYVKDEITDTYVNIKTAGLGEFANCFVKLSDPSTYGGKKYYIGTEGELLTIEPENYTGDVYRARYEDYDPAYPEDIVKHYIQTSIDEYEEQTYTIDLSKLAIGIALKVGHFGLGLEISQIEFGLQDSSTRTVVPASVKATKMPDQNILDLSLELDLGVAFIDQGFDKIDLANLYYLDGVDYKLVEVGHSYDALYTKDGAKYTKLEKTTYEKVADAYSPLSAGAVVSEMYVQGTFDIGALVNQIAKTDMFTKGSDGKTWLQLSLPIGGAYIDLQLAVALAIDLDNIDKSVAAIQINAQMRDVGIANPEYLTLIGIYFKDGELLLDLSGLGFDNMKITGVRLSTILGSTKTMDVIAGLLGSGSSASSAMYAGAAVETVVEPAGIISLNTNTIAIKISEKLVEWVLGLSALGLDADTQALINSLDVSANLDINYGAKYELLTAQQVANFKTAGYTLWVYDSSVNDYVVYDASDPTMSGYTEFYKRSSNISVEISAEAAKLLGLDIAVKNIKVGNTTVGGKDILAFFDTLDSGDYAELMELLFTTNEETGAIELAGFDPKLASLTLELELDLNAFFSDGMYMNTGITNYAGAPIEKASVGSIGSGLMGVKAAIKLEIAVSELLNKIQGGIDLSDIKGLIKKILPLINAQISIYSGSDGDEIIGIYIYEGDVFLMLDDLGMPNLRIKSDFLMQVVDALIPSEGAALATEDSDDTLATVMGILQTIVQSVQVGNKALTIALTNDYFVDLLDTLLFADKQGYYKTVMGSTEGAGFSGIKLNFENLRTMSTSYVKLADDEEYYFNTYVKDPATDNFFVYNEKDYGTDVTRYKKVVDGLLQVDLDIYASHLNVDLYLPKIGTNPGIIADPKSVGVSFTSAAEIFGLTLALRGELEIEENGTGVALANILSGVVGDLESVLIVEDDVTLDFEIVAGVAFKYSLEEGSFALTDINLKIGLKRYYAATDSFTELLNIYYFAEENSVYLDLSHFMAKQDPDKSKNLGLFKVTGVDLIGLLSGLLASDSTTAVASAGDTTVWADNEFKSIYIEATDENTVAPVRYAKVNNIDENGYATTSYNLYKGTIVNYRTESGAALYIRDRKSATGYSVLTVTNETENAYKAKYTLDNDYQYVLVSNLYFEVSTGVYAQCTDGTSYSGKKLYVKEVIEGEDVYYQVADGTGTYVEYIRVYDSVNCKYVYESYSASNAKHNAPQLYLKNGATYDKVSGKYADLKSTGNTYYIVVPITSLSMVWADFTANNKSYIENANGVYVYDSAAKDYVEYDPTNAEHISATRYNKVQTAYFDVGGLVKVNVTGKSILGLLSGLLGDSALAGILDEAMVSIHATKDPFIFGLDLSLLDQYDNYEPALTLSLNMFGFDFTGDDKEFGSEIVFAFDEDIVSISSEDKVKYRTLADVDLDKILNAYEVTDVLMDALDFGDAGKLYLNISIDNDTFAKDFSKLGVQQWSDKFADLLGLTASSVDVLYQTLFGNISGDGNISLDIAGAIDVKNLLGGLLTGSGLNLEGTELQITFDMDTMLFAEQLRATNSKLIITAVGEANGLLTVYLDFSNYRGKSKHKLTLNLGSLLGSTTGSSALASADVDYGMLPENIFNILNALIGEIRLGNGQIYVALRENAFGSVLNALLGSNIQEEKSLLSGGIYIDLRNLEVGLDIFLGEHEEYHKMDAGLNGTLPKEYVLIDGQYVLYDKDNPDHATIADHYEYVKVTGKNYSTTDDFYIGLVIGGINLSKPEAYKLNSTKTDGSFLTDEEKATFNDIRKLKLDINLEAEIFYQGEEDTAGLDISSIFDLVGSLLGKPNLFGTDTMKMLIKEKQGINAVYSVVLNAHVDLEDFNNMRVVLEIYRQEEGQAKELRIGAYLDGHNVYVDLSNWGIPKVAITNLNLGDTLNDLVGPLLSEYLVDGPATAAAGVNYITDYDADIEASGKKVYVRAGAGVTDNTFVIVNGKYVAYDSANAEHQGLVRYVQVKQFFRQSWGDVIFPTTSKPYISLLLGENHFGFGINADLINGLLAMLAEGLGLNIELPDVGDVALLFDARQDLTGDGYADTEITAVMQVSDKFYAGLSFKGLEITGNYAGDGYVSKAVTTFNSTVVQSDYIGAYDIATGEIGLERVSIGTTIEINQHGDKDPTSATKGAFESYLAVLLGSLLGASSMDVNFTVPQGDIVGCTIELRASLNIITLVDALQGGMSDWWNEVELYLSVTPKGYANQLLALYKVAGDNDVYADLTGLSLFKVKIVGLGSLLAGLLAGDASSAFSTELLSSGKAAADPEVVALTIKLGQNDIQIDIGMGIINGILGLLSDSLVIEAATTKDTGTITDYNVIVIGEGSSATRIPVPKLSSTNAISLTLNYPSKLRDESLKIAIGLGVDDDNSINIAIGNFAIGLDQMTYTHIRNGATNGKIIEASGDGVMSAITGGEANAYSGLVLNDAYGISLSNILTAVIKGIDPDITIEWYKNTQHYYTDSDRESAGERKTTIELFKTDANSKNSGGDKVSAGKVQAKISCTQTYTGTDRELSAWLFNNKLYIDLGNVSTGDSASVEDWIIKIVAGLISALQMMEITDLDILSLINGGGLALAESDDTPAMATEEVESSGIASALDLDIGALLTGIDIDWWYNTSVAGTAKGSKDISAIRVYVGGRAMNQLLASLYYLLYGLYDTNAPSADMLTADGLYKMVYSTKGTAITASDVLGGGTLYGADGTTAYTTTVGAYDFCVYYLQTFAANMIGDMVSSILTGLLKPGGALLGDVLRDVLGGLLPLPKFNESDPKASYLEIVLDKSRLASGKGVIREIAVAVNKKRTDNSLTRVTCGANSAEIIIKLDDNLKLNSVSSVKEYSAMGSNGATIAENTLSTQTITVEDPFNPVELTSSALSEAMNLKKVEAIFYGDKAYTSKSENGQTAAIAELGGTPIVWDSSEVKLIPGSKGSYVYGYALNYKVMKVEVKVSSMTEFNKLYGYFVDDGNTFVESNKITIDPTKIPSNATKTAAGLPSIIVIMRKDGVLQVLSTEYDGSGEQTVVINGKNVAVDGKFGWLAPSDEEIESGATIDVKFWYQVGQSARIQKSIRVKYDNSSIVSASLPDSLSIFENGTALDFTASNIDIVSTLGLPVISEADCSVNAATGIIKYTGVDGSKYTLTPSAKKFGQAAQGTFEREGFDGSIISGTYYYQAGEVAEAGLLDSILGLIGLGGSSEATGSYVLKATSVRFTDMYPNAIYVNSDGTRYTIDEAGYTFTSRAIDGVDVVAGSGLIAMSGNELSFYKKYVFIDEAAFNARTKDAYLVKDGKATLTSKYDSENEYYELIETINYTQIASFEYAEANCKYVIVPTDNYNYNAGIVYIFNSADTKLLYQGTFTYSIADGYVISISDSATALITIGETGVVTASGITYTLTPATANDAKSDGTFTAKIDERYVSGTYIYDSKTSKYVMTVVKGYTLSRASSVVNTVAGYTLTSNRPFAYYYVDAGKFTTAGSETGTYEFDATTGNITFKYDYTYTSTIDVTLSNGTTSTVEVIEWKYDDLKYSINSPEDGAKGSVIAVINNYVVDATSDTGFVNNKMEIEIDINVKMQEFDSLTDGDIRFNQYVDMFVEDENGDYVLKTINDIFVAYDANNETMSGLDQYVLVEGIYKLVTDATAEELDGNDNRYVIGEQTGYVLATSAEKSNASIKKYAINLFDSNYISVRINQSALVSINKDFKVSAFEFYTDTLIKSDNTFVSNMFIVPTLTVTTERNINVTARYNVNGAYDQEFGVKVVVTSKVVEKVVLITLKGDNLDTDLATKTVTIYYADGTTKTGLAQDLIDITAGATTYAEDATSLVGISNGKTTVIKSGDDTFTQEDILFEIRVF